MNNKTELHNGVNIPESMKLLQELHEQEYKEYIHTVPLSRYEQHLLRKWVAEGHSVYESAGSRYLPDFYPPRTFIDCYREDRAIEKELRGKSSKEREQYLKSYTGWDNFTRKEQFLNKEAVKESLRQKNREIFYLWEFIQNEGLWEEAMEFIDENINEPVPFEDEL